MQRALRDLLAGLTDDEFAAIADEVEVHVDGLPLSDDLSDLIASAEAGPSRHRAA